VKKKKKVEPAPKKRDPGTVGLGKRKRAGGDEAAASEVDGKAKEAEGDLKVDIVGAEEAVEGAGGAARKKKRRRRGKTGPAGGQDASGEAAGPSTGDDGGNESAGADDE
jgi:ribonuclease E